MPNISDIAKHVGVNKSTVSIVLNNKSSSVRISQKTREKILRAVDELQYIPSYSAKALATGKTYSLGLVIGGLESPYFAELTALTIREAEARGYHLLVSVTEWNAERELECFDLLLRRGVDGILMMSSSLQPGIKQYDYVRQERFPVVIMSHVAEGLSRVSTDWQPGMDQAIAHLKSKGHERIGFMNAVPDSAKAFLRKDMAFRAACLKNAITPILYKSSLMIEGARHFGRDLAGRPDRTTAVVAYSDYLAFGLMSGLHEKGVRVPQDLAVVGMDGTAHGQYVIPSLTSIGRDYRAMVTCWIDLLMKRIADRSQPPENVVIPTQLIVRESA